MKLATQTEGCVANPADGTLYVGEEDVGIWRFVPGETRGTLVAPVDNKQLVADVEGLALLRDGARTLLVASSQGDNATRCRVAGDDAARPLPHRRRVVGAAEETDGIELAGGSFGEVFPDGLFVAQDGHNQPAAQNFKLVSWATIKAALGL